MYARAKIESRRKFILRIARRYGSIPFALVALTLPVFNGLEGPMQHIAGQSGCAYAQAVPSAANIVSILRSANVVKADVTLNATVLDKKVLLITDRGSRGEVACKIDAVLMAKTVMEAYPDRIAQVKVMFSHPDPKLASQVVVTAGDVKAYGSGAIKPDVFLSSLEMTQFGNTQGDEQSGGSSVAEGPLMEKRLLLLHRIESLKSRGTGVKPFQDIFAQIEQSAQKGDEKSVKNQADFLSDKLSEQENLVKQAQIKVIPPRRGGVSSPGTASGASGTNGTSGAGGESAELARRLSVWEDKVKKWKAEGRDCDQLVASFALVRGWLSSNPTMAKNYLDALDATGAEPAPRR